MFKFATDFTGIGAVSQAFSRLQDSGTFEYTFATEDQTRLHPLLRKLALPPRALAVSAVTTMPAAEPAIDIYVATLTETADFEFAMQRVMGMLPRMFAVFTQASEEWPASRLRRRAQDLLPFLTNFRCISPTDVGVPHHRPYLVLTGERCGVSRCLLGLNHRATLEHLICRAGPAPAAPALTATQASALARALESPSTRDCYVVDLDQRRVAPTNCCPAPDRGSHGLYAPAQDRFLTTHDGLRIQGFDEAFIRMATACGLDDATLRVGMEGAVCVHVLVAVLKPMVRFLLCNPCTS